MKVGRYSRGLVGSFCFLFLLFFVPLGVPVVYS